MTQIDGISPVGLPWGLKDLARYEEACAAMEVRIKVMSTTDMQLLLGALVYDKRTRGFRGRALSMDVIGLRRGDRLEPSRECPNAGLLDYMDIPPGGLELVFWKHEGSDNAMIVHRNPLLSAATYLHPGSIMVDEMHCLFLGVFQAFCAVCYLGSGGR